MKYNHLFLIALIGYSSSAQDPRLFENTWYLQNVIIDGQDNFPPSNDEVPYIPLLIYESGFLLETGVCNMGTGIVDFSLIDSSFFFIDGMSVTLSECNNTENGVFEGIYFDGFFNSGYITVNDIFFYEIIDDGDGGYSLTITSPSGDQAIYGNEILSTNDFKDSQFAIYPNPVSEHLALVAENANGNIKIQIFNIQGKSLRNHNLNSQDSYTLDVSQLARGLYFLNIQSENGNVEVKKFIKE